MGYALIAYKPDSQDYCKGHLVASYSSNFISEFNLNENELTNHLIELCNSDYVCTVNGLYSETNPALMEHLKDIMNKKVEEAVQQQLKEEREAQAKFEAEEKLRIEKFHKDRELKERETYEKLKEKFGD